MAAQTKGIRIIEKILGALVALGALLAIGGAGLFIYVIFIRAPEIPEGGQLVASAKLSDGQRTVILDLPAFATNTSVQPRLNFTVHTDYYLERTSASRFGPIKTTEPAYRQWAKFEFSDAAGPRLTTKTALVNWDTAVDPNPEREAADTGQKMSEIPRHFRLRPPVPVSAGHKMTMQLEMLSLPEGDEKKPMEDPATQLGRFTDVEVSLYRDVADTQAYSEFNGEAPTWGLYAGLTGLALAILGIFAIAKLPIPPAPPKL